MTVCMAALCMDGDEPKVVVAADRMVTLGGFMEFEHTVPKMTYPAPHAAALIAGDTLLGTRLAKSVVADLRGAMPTVSEVAQRLAARYSEIRLAQLDNTILGPRGLDLPRFYGSQHSLNPQVTMMLDQEMARYNLGVELLLAGVDGEGGHIYSVHNPGPPELEHDVIGYGAVGSGGIHAIQAMIGFRHSPTAGLRETIFRVFGSKKRAEVAPGVGLDTDMAVVSASAVRFLSSETLKELGVLYDNYGQAAEEAQAKELEKLKLDHEEPDDDAGPVGA